VKTCHCNAGTDERLANFLEYTSFADEAGADRLPRLHPNEPQPLPEPHPRFTRARAAQGGVTLGLEQGEPEAGFSHLGRNGQRSRSLNDLLKHFGDHLHK
jgi:hypothetical protein